MAAKRFNADVRSVKARLNATPILGVAHFERGESDGEVVFHFSHPNLTDALPIRLLSSDIKAYPDDHHFMLFTDADDPPAAIIEALGDLQNYTFGQNVYNSIRDVSSGLERILDLKAEQKANGPVAPREDTCWLANDDEGEDVDEDYGSDYDDYYEEMDNGIYFTTPRQLSLDLPASPTKCPRAVRRMKRDLRKARNAGAKVSILTGVDPNASTHIISLSVRANKLGLSLETLEAWDVEPSDYIVLLLQTKEPYPAADRVKDHNMSSFQVAFRLGKCSFYKPDINSARRAFDTKSPARAAVKIDSESREFNQLFISMSLDPFMNDDFLALFKIRMGVDCNSWDDATSALRDRKFNISTELKNGSKKTARKGQSGGSSKKSTVKDRQSGASLLCFDSFAESPKEISTPLVAMQFAIHYFVRCTEYCLRCHQKLDKGFEALKPFVCSDPLCLFQYITMGLGPSIEHDIVTQPYVVDLLVSLCYSSVQSVPSRWGNTFSIREFPTGLRLMVPREPGSKCDSSENYILVSAYLQEKTLTVKHPDDIHGLIDNTWVTLSAPSQHNPEKWLKHQAYITCVDRENLTAEIKGLRLDRSMTLDEEKPALGPRDMRMSVHEVQFDDLDDKGKAYAMAYVLETLPPVSHLREFLIQNPLKTLKHYPEIPPAVFRLLQWIVASNRSCISQVTSVKDRHATDQRLLKSIKVEDQEAIRPLMDEHVQFRFLQGTPDKEIRFQRALRDREAGGQNKYPTLFAWHGSGVTNWHSILRQGLDFKVVTNGRSYGNGVYFSRAYQTSLGYALGGVATWPNSSLRITNALALCEIINRPDEFVSQDPHYVVSQVDWIQCRYLFVRIEPEAKAPPTAQADPEVMDPEAEEEEEEEAVEEEVVEEVAQEPRLEVLGVNGVYLKIPSKAFPSRQIKGQMGKQGSKLSSKRSHASFQAVSGTDEEDSTDMEALCSSDDEDSKPPHKKATADGASRESSIGMATSHSRGQDMAKRPITPPNTDFRPGSLDLTSVPRLSLPTWANANSSKRLATDIKRLQKIQSDTPLHELGWYVDFEKIENMFQWIVELHSFDSELPLAHDMKKAGITSVVLDVRFGRDYPYTPPFVRVIRPQFLPFAEGGGGHVTIGGAICMELLTSNGWLPATTMDSVFLSIKLAMSSTDPAPARLHAAKVSLRQDYTPWEALEAFQRAAQRHGWIIPGDSRENASQKFVTAYSGSAAR